MAYQRKVANYGTWTSPITAELVSGASLRFNEIHADSTNGTVYLVEERPSNKGRSTIVEFNGTATHDILPSQYDVRTKIHEYGGGACAVTPDGSIIFTDTDTSGVFKYSSGSVTVVFEGSPSKRFGDFYAHPEQKNLILAVHEDHSGKEVINSIVLLDERTKSSKTVVEGADFYLSPSFSPDGKSVCWTQWNHPDMPWTGTELWFAEWTDHGVARSTKPLGAGKRLIAGVARKESVCQPRWSTNGKLLFASDRTGFWQMYQFDPSNLHITPLKLDGFENAEFGGRPMLLGETTYIELNDHTWVLVYTRNATNGILLYDTATKTHRELPLGLVQIEYNCLAKVSDTKFAVLGATATSPAGLYLVDINQPTKKSLLRSTSGVEIAPAFLSEAKHVTFPRTHGKVTGSSHAVFIPPKNPDFEAEPGSKPPLIVRIHGGPTGHTTPGLDLTSQYFTSRGYAFCEVNYGGSTGYGRVYRESLNYAWGVLDVDDSVSAVDYLSREGLVDGSKSGIIGGSAGGYTVLQSLVIYPNKWAAGVSRYGIGNLKALADMTHKFEAHYLFDLLFPESATEEEKEKVYHDRSPCFHADRIDSPLLLLQGSEDRVVPQEQAEEMERIVKENGGDVKLIVFEGEGHGFRMQHNIMRSIEETEKMWQRTLLS